MLFYILYRINRGNTMYKQFISTVLLSQRIYTHKKVKSPKKSSKSQLKKKN